MTVVHHHGHYEVRYVSPTEAFAPYSDANCMWICDTNVEAAYGAQFPKAPIVFPAGEASKDLATFGELLGRLAREKAHRQTVLIAVGGGVTGDLVGFVAAAYMRGIRYVQVPTTLLAQVDSSVGGKVGIDLPEGKNLAGAFHPPVEVRISVDLLATLPDRQIRNGMAEVWKTAYILDKALLRTLRAGGSRDRQELVARCVARKAEVVAEDEFETKGLRAVLNFGHTIGHALEQATGYTRLLHGEAVAVGMVAEARLGEALGITPPGIADAVRADMQSEGLPDDDPLLAEGPRLLDAMRRDKKARGGRLAFSLLTGEGECKLVHDVPEEAVLQALERR